MDLQEVLQAIHIREQEVFYQKFYSESLIKIKVLTDSGCSEQKAKDIVISERFNELCCLLKRKIDLVDMDDFHL